MRRPAARCQPVDTTNDEIQRRQIRLRFLFFNTQHFYSKETEE